MSGGPAQSPVPPAAAERARLLLEPWRASLQLNGREAGLLAGELAAVDRQLLRLAQRRPRVAVFGRVGVGKSSLLNALLDEEVFATDVAHGCTRHQQAAAWDQPLAGLAGAELVDTPGIDEIGAASRARLAGRVALGSDLVLMVLDADLSRVELEALEVLRASGKPLLLVLNRCDCWPQEELPALLASIRRRLPPQARALELIAVAAAPRQARLMPDGRVRSELRPAAVGPLRQALIALLEGHGELLLAINSLRSAERFHQVLQEHRLRQSRRAAQGLIGRFAAMKATGVAVNPLVLLDLAGGLACDTALVMQLCRLYGLPMGAGAARQLLTRLSGHNALLGGAQLGIQALLGGLRQVLLVAAPFTGGLSLAPAAPVAVAQAALAVHTTRRTGELAALELMRGARRGGRPGALLRRLAASDPSARRWLGRWPERDGSRLTPGRGNALGEGLLP
ncbi:GTP-binding protein [Cyanobium sp. NIES-981]|uniref:GTP-binding protein n=1 Tax=Cyanobium sp. NIES-981 TaxID=1851505 RepID=UPI0007DDDBD6|nr:GTP-binding protein [Cyanobium sp. NIES-981]SBO44527.1 GTP-binding protein [Cyanobium sp. NIES-981]